ncbi:AraC-type DNA-binding protein [Paenimyroides ummariense]|uniref:AraC-type DNA-binding protein n=1 Tax=Paenimyroides ummariense TaxID=913024 RepID=A0A1I4ZMV3_9FLAO|nr:AraC family transcriptional regulator [Paenimyroides ummariense]SFN51585.1 AraC-type DNA-binding protein [Paenimyroides ummariense]
MNQFPIYKFNEEDIQNNLVRVVQLEESSGYIFDTFHTHEYNEMLIFISGGGTHNINFKIHEICDYSIHLLAANDLHWVERAHTSNGFAVMYKDQLLHKLRILNQGIDFFDLFGNSNVINLNKQDKKSYEFIFDEIGRNRQNADYLLQLVAALIVRIASTHFELLNTKCTSDPLIHKIGDLIETNYKKHLTLVHYAGLLNIEPRTLQNRVNKISGKTIKELQNDRLLKEAKRLICISGLSISEIAFELGFNDTAYFSNWFKKHTNIIPSEYKM